MTDWRLHDLRRTVSTRMNELGLAEPHVIEAILGHTVKGVAGVYNRAKHESCQACCPGGVGRSRHGADKVEERDGASGHRSEVDIWVMAPSHLSPCGEI